MIRTKKRIRLCLALLMLNLAFIWGNSLMSAEASLAFSNWVKSLLDFLSGDATPGEGGSGMLRKIAHFTEFATLGMLLTWLAAMLGETGLHLRIVPVFCGMAAACVDETIQVFVPERGPGLIDVWIDTCGAAAGMMLLLIGYHYIQKRKHKNKLEETT